MRFSVPTALATLAALTVAAPAPAQQAVVAVAAEEAAMAAAAADPAHGFYLRIMPLGASITYGYRSPDGNGYRLGLRQALRYAGWDVNMVGSQAAGNMTDNENDGFPGYRVEQVAAEARKDMPRYKPNVVLINCGTNDALQHHALDTIGARMEALLVDAIWRVVPDTVVVLSTLLPQTHNPAGAAVANAQFRRLAARLRHAGNKIILAEMDDGWITVEELVDGTHPTEEGYRKMAARFYQAIRLADRLSWLRPPVPVNEPDAGGDDDGAIEDPHLPQPPADAGEGQCAA